MPFFSDIDLQGDKGERRGKSLDLDDDYDYEDDDDDDTMDALRKLFKNSDIDRLRDKIIGDKKKSKRKGRHQNKEAKFPQRIPKAKRKRPRSGKKRAVEVSRREVSEEEAKKLKENVRTILKPGQLEEIRKTGTFDWNSKRIKRYEVFETKEVDEEVTSEEEEEEDYYNDDEEGTEDYEQERVSEEEKEEPESSRKDEDKLKRRKRILNLVEKLLSMQSDK